MTADIVAFPCPSIASVALPHDDDGVAIVAGELLAQHGAEAVAVVAGWSASERTTSYTTAFWRQVVDEIRRRACGDRRETSSADAR